MFTIGYSARSHIGRVRQNNEDNLFVNGVTLRDIGSRQFAIDGFAEAPAIFAVCDGMGGEENGEIASALAVNALLRHSTQLQNAKPKQLSEMVQDYVEDANSSIRRSVEGRRTGTTLALAVVLTHGIFCFNMGDSRIYYQRPRVFKQLTYDHTWAAEQERYNPGAYSASGHDRNGHKLTRCLGIGPTQAAEDYPPLSGECRILICSDGLTNMVNTDEINRNLNEYTNPTEAADALLNAALLHGGHDNITLIVMDVKKRKLFFRK